jgi:hypothetical protein
MNANQGEIECPPLPEIAPLPHDDLAGCTSLSVSIVEGAALNLWSIATATEGKTKEELKLQLQPDQSVVIGRQEGGEIEYLDPRYQPTQMLPNSSQRVITSVSKGNNVSVSRGHFMLKSSIHGIMLLNGVPRRGGGIRPPLNGTVMLEPVYHSMGEGEEYLIENGSAAKIRLPNGTVILLRAE